MKSVGKVQRWKMKNLLVVFLFLHTDGLLYPYGPSTDKVTPKSDDGASPPIPANVTLFGKNYSSIYVNNNGLLSFDAPLGSSTPQHLPVATRGPFLAPFWTDVNNEISGNIYYRLSSDSELLKMTENYMSRYFSAVPFSPKWVFVATWDKVPYYGSKTNKVNTFQAALSTDMKSTFIIFNYIDIQWPTGKENEGPPALAGCNSGLPTGFFEIPGSLTPNMINITHTSNVNIPGLWVFKVEQGEFGPPTNNADITTSPTPTKTYFTSQTTTREYGLLYPYGPSTDKVTPKSDDGVSPSIPAAVPLFGKNYSSIYVNNNGVLSFNAPLGSSAPQHLPIATSGPILAPFWTDVNNEISGNIYYRLSSDSELLKMTENYMSRYFPAVHFSPKWVFVATWDKVAYYGSTTNKVNTFQAALSTDENSTFIIFNYIDIQWPTGKANEGPPALAGYNSGFSKGFFEIPGSLTPDMINITHTSNVNFPGLWVFKVEQGEVGPPTTNAVSESLLYPYGPSTDKVTPKSDDGVSPPIPASVPLFGKNYSSIYVNNNGVLSFDAPLGSSTPQHLPIDTRGPFLAPFWTDVNNEISGNIYYRLSSDSELLKMTENYVSRYFPAVPFSPKWVFVATWHKVAYYGSTTNKVNTFQAALSTDMKSTFIMFNYGDIQWPTGKANEGPPALAGCNGGLNKGYFEIPGSLTADMINIMHTSNVNFLGNWVFKVDQVEVESPTNTGLLYPYGPSTDRLTPKSDDGVSPPIPAIVPLFGKNYSSIYVNNNGLLSFDAALGSSAPQHLPIDTRGPLLAPFWADVNNEISGNIYYRLSSDSELLNITKNYMSRYFPAVLFSPKWVFVATWDKVPYFGSTTNKVNTFQAALSTDMNSTLIMFNYIDIQWPTGKTNEGPSALAGCNGGLNKGYYEIPGSLTPNMINIMHTKNVNFPGWLLKVDEVEVEFPTNNTAITTSPTPTKMYFTSQKVTDLPSTNYTTHNTKVTSPSLGSNSSATTIIVQNTTVITTRVHGQQKYYPVVVYAPILGVSLLVMVIILLLFNYLSPSCCCCLMFGALFAIRRRSSKRDNDVRRGSQIKLVSFFSHK